MSLSSGDLTTLATAQSYVQPLPSPTVLQGLISRVSMSVRNYLNRPLLVPTAYTEQYDGTGTQQLVLTHYPLIGPTLTSLKISGVSVPIAPQIGTPNPPPPSCPWGYRLQPWNGIPPGSPAVVELVGFSFLYGRQNVVVQYTAGYEVVGETQTIPTGMGPYTVMPLTPYGSWATDQGVTYAATGIALTPITSGTPAQGQYVPPTPGAATPVLNYTFAAADAGEKILLSYGFIPSDIEQVVLEEIAERAAYRTRVGVRSQSLASQEALTYFDGLNAWARQALMPYVSVLPPAMGATV